MASPRLTVVVAASAFAGCSLWLHFDPEGQPCDAQGACLAGYQCVSSKCTHAVTPTDACVACTDAGPDGGRDAGTADAGPADAGCVNLACQIATCPTGQTTSISGIVRDPSGQLPLSGALVYVPNAAVQPFPPTATCQQCGQWVSGAPLVMSRTDAGGEFQLTGAPNGAAIPLVVQLGRWRKQVQVAVQPCQDNAVPPDSGLSNLPRTQLEGDIPRMAIVTGLGDQMECTLLKLGVAPEEFTRPDGGGRIHLYYGNGSISDGGSPSAASLFDAGVNGLLPYDEVLLPCQAIVAVPAAPELRALMSYTTLGGRVATSHYGASWIQDAPAPFPSTADWRSDGGILPLALAVTLNTAFPKGQEFARWLDGLGVADAGILVVSNARSDVGLVNSPTTAWMFGDDTGKTAGTNYDWTPYLSFDTPFDAGAGPGCGRVGFFDFHVGAAGASGTVFPGSCVPGPLTDNEKAAAFLLFDLGTCPSP